MALTGAAAPAGPPPKAVVRSPPKAVVRSSAKAIEPAPQAIVDAATQAVQELQRRQGSVVAPLLGHAKAILVAPKGPGGNGVLLMHWRSGWSEPAFFDAASLGGPKPSILLIMTDHGLDEVLHQHGLNLDGPDALSVAPLAAKAEAALLLWPKRAQLDAAGFQQADALNALWYGRSRSAPDIVGGTPPDQRSAGLRQALAGRLGPGALSDR